jgi:hypothetical protein
VTLWQLSYSYREDRHLCSGRLTRLNMTGVLPDLCCENWMDTLIRRLV